MAVINDSGFAVHCGELLTADGEKLLTLVKGTFLCREAAAALAPVPLEQARPVRFAVETWGDPVTTPPKYPADVAPLKAATDVVVVAKGYAPGGKPTHCFDVSVTVGSVSKTLRIYGVRVWQQSGAGLSAPRAVLEQEIRYDAAWGGLDMSDPDRPLADMRNPVGNGVVRDTNRLSDRLAPCIEDPDSPLRSASTKPPPAGIGPLDPHWSPRREHAGTYDETWLRDQAPLPPADMDPRHYQVASPGLLADPPLQGGEPVQLSNLTPGGGLVSFSLPAVGPIIDHEVATKPAGHFEPPIDTVIVDTLHVPDDALAVVELVWRTLTPMPRRMAEHEVLVRPRA